MSTKKIFLRIPLRKKKKQQNNLAEIDADYNDIYTDGESVDSDTSGQNNKNSKTKAKEESDNETETTAKEEEPLPKKEDKTDNSVENEYENLMSSMQVSQDILNENDHCISNEKHAISMRQISIREDKKKQLQMYSKQSLGSPQFAFITKNLESFFSLNNYKCKLNLIDFQELNLTQLFNITNLEEFEHRIKAMINSLEEFILNSHFEVIEKSVTFKMENYQKMCNSLKNKFESCPILYLFVLENQISFKALLSSNMSELALNICNTILRKKMQRQLEFLLKRQNAINIESLLFADYHKKHENNKELLYDNYIAFCQTYLSFLRQFPDYKTAVINDNKEMNKILKLTKEELLAPPALTPLTPSVPLISPLTKKRKHKHESNGSDSMQPNTKKRKITIDITDNDSSNIFDGLVINDSVKCHIKMKQIGGKSIWTLPFIGNKLSITGRISILSVLKFIKQLRKHKSRRIVFAEVHSNEYIHHNSYNILSSQLHSSKGNGKAGVIDCEKKCGIIIYLISSTFFTNHSVSYQLNKYFDGHKITLPKSKIFSIIVLGSEVYKQVKKVKSKSKHLRSNKRVQNNDDVWNTLANEIEEDDLGVLPPPLPAHLLAERESIRIKESQQSLPPNPPPLPYSEPPPLPQKVPALHMQVMQHSMPPSMPLYPIAMPIYPVLPMQPMPPPLPSVPAVPPIQPPMPYVYNHY